MRLVTGGCFQGKLDFAKQFYAGEPIVADGARCETKEAIKGDILFHFHEMVKQTLVKGDDPFALADELIEKGSHLTIVVNELGCGIVPTDAFDREYRETVGRICCILSKHALEVYRVSCGIGIKMK